MKFELKNVMAHKPPMLLVDALTLAEDTRAKAVFSVKEDNIFLDEHGALAREALVEIMAQTLAGFNAYKAHIENKPAQKGFLVGLRGIVLHADARAGDTLESEIEISDFIAGTFIAKGKIYNASALLCEGELRIFTFD